MDSWTGGAVTDQIAVQVGDCRELLAATPARTFHACVTDPPYELGFMGKRWDRTGVAFDPATWAAVRRVLRPGAHLLAFGGSRTYHRMACAIEDAGFEVRDCLMWLYGSGFPKSHNLDGAWAGWGTALKPAHEPIILARVPLEGTVAENVARWGCGALCVEAGRIGTEEITTNHTRCAGDTDNWIGNESTGESTIHVGRWPANVLLDEVAAGMVDGQAPDCPAGAGFTPKDRSKVQGVCYGGFTGTFMKILRNDTGGASRFFYVAKASRAERDAGCGGMALRETSLDFPQGGIAPGNPRGHMAHNHHPTVKPIALMRYLLRLVMPPGGVVVDPFAGSGTTLCAAAQEAMAAVGMEQSAEYAAIIRARVAYWARFPHLETDACLPRAARVSGMGSLFEDGEAGGTPAFPGGEA